jgi:transposase
MTIYCGVDFHARVQTVCYCDSSAGEVHVRDLHHQRDDVRAFYSSFKGEVIVGLEASGYSSWFEQMIEELGHQVWLGDAVEIRRMARRRQKNDHRDAELILDLLVRDQFPRVHRPSLHSREVLRQLRYRQRLVKMRTMVKNSLHALALGAGLSLRSGMATLKGRQRLLELPLEPASSFQREQWLSLLDELNRRIAQAEVQLERQAKGDEQIRLLRTHPGIGLLTSLGLLHTLEPVTRFSNRRKVVAYVGLEPMERSSGERQRFLGISKAGSRLLRFLLIEAANVAIRVDADLRRFYRQVANRRGIQRAKVATARKLLVRAFIMLRDGIDYAEFLRRGVEAGPARLGT